MNKSVQYAKAVLFGDIVAPSQVKQSCVNFLYEYNILWSSLMLIFVSFYIKVKNVCFFWPINQNSALTQENNN